MYQMDFFVYPTTRVKFLITLCYEIPCNMHFFFYISAAEVGYLRKNLKAVMAGKEPKDLYDGYTSCPLILSPKHCILAEFDFQAPPQPLETFPYNQAKPRYVSRVLESESRPRQGKILLYYFFHSVARANLNKSEWLVINPTAASKYMTTM